MSELRELNQHDLRHRRVTTWLAAGKPAHLVQKALDHWAHTNRVELNFNRPGKPGDNPHIEAFNPVVRRGCLTQHWLLDLDDAQDELGRWRLDCNTVRPHGSLQRSAPAQVGAGALFTPGPERLQDPTS